MDDRNRMDIKEFVGEGYLQEANRQFFHPLGLALEVQADDLTGAYYLSGVWDYRKDPDGIYFGLNKSAEERIKKFTTNAQNIKAKKEAKLKARKEILDVDENGIEVIPRN